MNPSRNQTLEPLPVEGGPVDLAAFASWRWWTGTERQDLHTHPLYWDSQGCLRPALDPASGEWHLGMEWNEPQDICRVEVEFNGPVPADFHVQYWQKNWPNSAPERSPGAHRGWLGRDDPWHGKWVTVSAERQDDGSKSTFIFDPVDLPELRMAGFGSYDMAPRINTFQHHLARFRRTLKLRLVSRGETCPVVSKVQAFAPGAWREVSLDIQFEHSADVAETWDQKVQVTNGHLLSVQAKNSVLHLDVLYNPGDPASTDGTVLTVQSPVHPFSFLAADLEKGPIYIKDYGVWVTRSDSVVSAAEYREQMAQTPKPIYDRVDHEPEQSLARAMAEIPPLDVTKQGPADRYVLLGVDAGRQELALRYNGELYGDKRVMKLFGRDAARLLWPGYQLRYRFASGDPPDFRERRDGTKQEALEGWLPVFKSSWLDREFEYEQTAFGAMLAGPMTPPDQRSGEENVVIMMRFAIRNTTHGQKRARLWIAISPQEDLEVRDGLVLALGRVVPDVQVTRQWRVDAYETAYLRTAIQTHGRGKLSAVPYSEEPGGSLATPSAVAYDIDLQGGEAHSITLAFPVVTLTKPEEWQQAARLDYEGKLADVVAYWKGFVGSGGQVQLPEQIINEFHKASRVHVPLVVDKDPASGLMIVPAGGWAYGACGNEACWQITMLDQAGHHNTARTYLQTYFDTQGWLGLDGNFSSAEGVMQGMDLDMGRPVQSHFSYNTDHGYIMETMADHYRYSGDREWLEKNAAQLIAACDFVIREREATKVTNEDGSRLVEWGLLPAGHLEDNPEWRYWFAVNAHAYEGLRSIAEVLAEINHPEAARLVQAAKDYREDIRAAARRSMIDAPVVQLLDGTYIPQIPTRTAIRGRDWGWFRAAAYGAIHLLECNVFEPNEPEATWLIKDLEDNLYPTRDYGRPVDLEKYWFSHGGVAIQASLTDFAVDYLRRGQVKHGLRSLFNHFGASIYADVRCFTEHPVVELGHGIGPFYKTPDEAKWLSWLRAFLMHEEGDRLHIAPGAPREWLAPGKHFGVKKMATFFGPVTYEFQADEQGVTLQVEISDQRPPNAVKVHVRCPEGKTIQAVTVNGQPYTDFDAAKEFVQIAQPAGQYTILVDFA
jgi:hypothetical protein